MKQLRDYEFWLLLGVIVLGISYRCIDLTIPDFSTDEAQFALGQSAAQPPLSMWFFRLSQFLFGPTILAVRSVSVLWGVISVVEVALIASILFGKRSAWWTAAVAAIMPPAIIYSRLAYLTSFTSVVWLFSSYAFLRATDEPKKPWLWLLFVLSTIAAGFMQSQGLLLALMFNMGMWMMRTSRRYSWSEKILCASSLLPGILYIIVHPEIIVSFTLVGGSESQIGFMMRAREFFIIWLLLLGPFALCLVASARQIIQSRWPIMVLLATGLILSLILTPRPYYATYALFFAIPMGAFLVQQRLAWRTAILVTLCLYTAVRLGPVNIVGRGMALDPFNYVPYWNTHATAINAVLQNDPQIVVYGHAGHHVRWYLEPTVLIGKSMSSVPAIPALAFKQSSVPAEVSTRGVLYTDDQVTIYDSH